MRYIRLKLATGAAAANADSLAYGGIGDTVPAEGLTCELLHDPAILLFEEAALGRRRSITSVGEV